MSLKIYNLFIRYELTNLYLIKLLKKVIGLILDLNQKISLFFQSIFKIQEAFNTHDKVFVSQKVLKLHSTKSTQVGGIPAEMLKSTVDIHASIPTKIINLSLKNGCFPDDFRKLQKLVQYYEKF